MVALIEATDIRCRTLHGRTSDNCRTCGYWTSLMRTKLREVLPEGPESGDIWTSFILGFGDSH
jgi:hypothetical protein